jgi:DNA-binding transcriptional ArsR family regulator
MSSTSQDGITQDVVYEILSNPRRRFVLSYLREHGEPIALTDLATVVAARENDIDQADLTDRQEKRVYVSLYQTHIPKLEKIGIVDYDSDAGTVQLTEAVDQVEQYIPSNDDDIAWHRYYLVAAAVAAGLYALLFLDAPVIGDAPQTLISAFVVVVLVALAVTHLVYVRVLEPRRRTPSFRPDTSD